MSNKTSHRKYNPNAPENPNPSDSCVPNDSIKQQTIRVTNYEVELLSPPDSVPVIGTIVALPGWNFPRTDWCAKSSLCKKALKKGYRLVLPEMGKSNYMTHYYPETRKEWRVYPTRKWLSDTLIPTLQKTHCILRPEQNNYVLGLSTGGRGAVIAVLSHPTLFKACAALSGDYDQTKLPNEILYYDIYGKIEQYPDRWKYDDNPVHEIQKLQTPLYLGHGLKDKVCPYDQTVLYAKAVTEAHPKLKLVVNLPPEHGHDYQYWDSEVDNMLGFFEQVTKPTPKK